MMMIPFPLSYLLLLVAVGLGVVYVSRACLGLRIAIAATLCVVPWLTRGPGPAQLILGLLLGYSGVRMAALAHLRRVSPGRSNPRAIAVSLVSLEDLLRPSKKPAPRPLPMLAIAAAEIAVTIALLVAGNEWRLWQRSLLGRFADDLLVMIEVGVGADGIHRAIIGVAGLYGRAVQGLQDAPLLSTSLTEFWARRWNRLIQANLQRGFFQPLAARGRTKLGVLAAFAASGVLHVLAVAGAASPATVALPCASVMLFFLLHGVAIVAERRLGWHRAPTGWRVAGSRLRSILLFTLLSPLLLDPFARVTRVHGRSLQPPENTMVSASRARR